MACSPTTSTSQTSEPQTTTPNLAARLSDQLTSTAVMPSPTRTPPMTTTPIPSEPTGNPTLTQTVRNIDTITAVYTNTPISSPTHTPIPQVKITYHAVNLRRGPRTDYPIIGFLYEGDIVEIIGIHGGSDGWYNVQLPDGLTGWVGTSVVEPAFLFDVTSIPTAATIPATSTPTPTNTPTPTSTFTPRPRPTQPKPTQPKPSPTPVAIPPTATIISYP